MGRITKTFKSGNSVAVRLPKALGVQPGMSMRVREERGRYIIEPVDADGAEKIDLSGIWGSCPGRRPLTPAEREFEESDRPWHLLEKRG